MAQQHKRAFHARTIVLDPQADEEAQRARKVFSRFDQAMDGLEWLLARSPDRGMTLRIPGKDARIYVQSSGDLTGVPSLWVAYSFDEDQVVIMALRAV